MKTYFNNKNKCILLNQTGESADECELNKRLHSVCAYNRRLLQTLSLPYETHIRFNWALLSSKAIS